MNGFVKGYGFSVGSEPTRDEALAASIPSHRPRTNDQRLMMSDKKGRMPRSSIRPVLYELLSRSRSQQSGLGHLLLSCVLRNRKPQCDS